MTFADGEQITLENKTTGGITGAACIVGVIYVPTVANSALLWFHKGGAFVSSPTENYQMAFMRVLAQTNESLTVLPLPRGGTLAGADCRLYVETVLGAGRSITIHVRKNAANSGVSWSLTDATPIGTLAASGSATFAEDDRINLYETGNGGSTGLLAGASLLLR